MTYREDLEGRRIVMRQCPKCGCAALSIEVDDSGWDDGLEHYIEYARVHCGECGEEHKVRIVYTESEWVEGWGHHPDEE